MIDCNWASFVTLCHHQNTNKLCHCQCQICCQSPSQFRYLPARPRQTHRYHFRSNCSKLRNTTFVILQNPFEIIATTFASHGTCRNFKKDRMINHEVKTRGLFTHSQTLAINSNLHNTSHNEALRFRLVFSTCFDDVFHGNNGVISYDAAHVVNAGWRRIECYARKRTGLRRRAASARGTTICAD